MSEKNITYIIDPEKNFLTIDEPKFELEKFVNPDVLASHGIDLTHSQGGQVRYIRWGWFEDNIISRYISLGNEKSSPRITFRSVQPKVVGGEVDRDKKESVKIANYYLAKPINPSHSLIFQSGMFGDHSKADTGEGTGAASIAVLYERFLSNITADMISNENGPDRGFRVKVNDVLEDLDDDSSKNSKGQEVDKSNPNGLGYLRNIFINIEVIQKHFGIDTDKMNASDGSDQGFVTEGVNDTQHIRQSILNLMSDVSRNFFGIWDMIILEDPEDPNNSILQDNNAVPNGDLAFTKFTEDKDGSLKIVNEGVYKFPSFKIDSTVKSQELNISIGNNLQYYSLLGSGTNDVITPPNPILKRFQRFSEVTRSPDKKEDRLDTLYPINVLEPDGGYKNASPDDKFEKDAGLNHPKNIGKLLDGSDTEGKPKVWKKYAPAYNRSTQISDPTDPDDMTISFDNKTGMFQQIEIIDLAQAVESNDAEALGFAAGELGVSVDDIKTQFGPKDEPSSTTNTDPNIPIEVSPADGKITKTAYVQTDESLAAQSTLDSVGDEDKVFDRNGKEIKPMMEVFLEQVAKGTAVEIEQDVQNAVKAEKEADPAPPPPKIKVKSVTRPGKKVAGIYSYSKGKSTDLVIERLSIKTFLEQAIKSKKDGVDRDAQAIIKLGDYAELSLTIDGIGGLIPGHAFHVDYMPIKFNKPVYAPGGQDVGSQAFFRILGHTQTITDAGWVTEIRSGMVNNPHAQNVVKQMSQERLEEYFLLNSRRSFGMEDTSGLNIIKNFIDSAGRFLVGAKSYIDENYGNTADGFNFNKYRKNQGIAKAIAEAKTEEDREKIISSLDVDIKTIGDYDGGLFQQSLEIVGLTAATAGTAVVAGVKGAGTVAGVAAAGSVATLGRLDRDPVGIFPEWFNGGKSVETETVVKNDGKTDKELLPSGAGKGKASAKESLDEETVIEEEIAIQNDKATKLKTQEEVAKATDQPLPLESIIKKIKFILISRNSVTSDSGGFGTPDAIIDRNVTSIMEGEYQGVKITKKRTLTDKGSLVQVGIKNEALLVKEIAQSFKEQFPDIGMAIDAQIEEINVPPPPFLEATKNDAPFGDREPKWDSASQARQAIANKFGFKPGRYSLYRDDRRGGGTIEDGKAKRLKDWANSEDLWTKNEQYITE